MGPVIKQVKKRVGTLSVKLHELFRQYIASGKVPSVQSLKKAKFKFRPGKCYAYGCLKRRSRVRVVTSMACTEEDKMCPKVYAEGFVLERFRAWAKRMKISHDGRLLFVGNDKIIIPKEHFPDLVRKVHTKDGASGLKHRSFVKTLKVLRKMYSIGRRQFGISPQYVKKIVQFCTDEKCSAKQYKLHRHRGLLTNNTRSTVWQCHSSDSDNSLMESNGDDNTTTDTDLNIDTIDMVSNLCDSSNNVQNTIGDHRKKHNGVTSTGAESSDFHHELFNLAPKCLSNTEHEADCGFGSDQSLAAMLDSEQSTRDDSPHQTPPGKPCGRMTPHHDKVTHGVDNKTCCKSVDKIPDVHKVCAPLWIPPAPQSSEAAQSHADKKSPKISSFTSPKHHGSTLEPKTHSQRQMVGRAGCREKVQSTGKGCKGSSWESPVGSVQAYKSAPVEKNTSYGLDSQQDRKKIGTVVTTHSKKLGHLLDVIQQMKMDIRPACANNQMAQDRLKRKIHIGLSVLTECRCLLHKYEDTRCPGHSYFK